MRHLILVLALIGAAFGKDHAREWRTGKLVQVGQESWTSQGSSYTSGTVNNAGNVNMNTNTTSWNHVTFSAAIDGGDYTYFAERTLSFRFQHSPQWTENTEVKYALEKDALYVLGENGKEFKMYVVKRRKD